MGRLGLRGRHFKIGGIVISQYLAFVKKGTRSNFDRTMLLHDSSLSNRQFAYATAFADIQWEEYNMLYEAHTVNHGVLISSSPSIGEANRSSPAFAPT